jgi:hypothetical protein
MGLLGDLKNLNPGQFPGMGNDPQERHAPLSRYGTNHPVDKALWKVDRVKEIRGKMKSKKVAPHEVLGSVAASQKSAAVGR